MRIKLRAQTGQGVIMLSVAIGLIIIPLLGLFTFEVARYQHGVMQLENNCDSAALAGAAMLVTSPYQARGERQRRWTDVEAAAGNALKSAFPATASQLQDVLGADMKNAQAVPTGGTLKLGPRAGYCEYIVEPVDPANFNVVAVTADTAKAIRVRALFTAMPAFARYLGSQSLVPVNARATAGIPVLDLVVCFDVSGSMDDSTRVSFVMRQFRIPGSAQDLIKPSYNQYLAANTAFNERWANKSSAYCARYGGSFASEQNAVTGLFNNYLTTRDQVGRDYGYVDYHQVMTGTLDQCLFRAPVQAEGWPTNVQYPQQLQTVKGIPTAQANPSLPTFCWPERFNQQMLNTPFPGTKAPIIPFAPTNYSGQCADPIAPGTPFTDITIKADGAIVANKLPDGRPQQPLFYQYTTTPEWPDSDSIHPTRFTYTKVRPPYQGRQYVFDGMAYLVEASRGNLEYNRYESLKRTLFKNNIAKNELPTVGQDGYQLAYQEMAGYYAQPIGSTVSALENFYQALNSVGADVFFGMTAFETEVGVSENGTTSTALADIADTTPACQDPLAPQSKKRPLYHINLTPIEPKPDTARSFDAYTGQSLTLFEKFEANLVPLRSTNIAGALHDALNMLNSSPRKAFARQAILLITDGVATVTEDGAISSTGLESAASKECQNYADTANGKHIPIFCVGVAQNPQVASLQNLFLGDNITSPNQGLASRSGNGARYFQITNKDLTVAGNSSNEQQNAISESLQQVVRGFVQLME